MPRGQQATAPPRDGLRWRPSLEESWEERERGGGGGERERERERRNTRKERQPEIIIIIMIILRGIKRSWLLTPHHHTHKSTPTQTYLPYMSTQSMWAELEMFLSIVVTTSRWPLLAAACRGVRLVTPSCTNRAALLLSRYSTTSLWGGGGGGGGIKCEVKWEVTRLKVKQ